MSTARKQHAKPATPAPKSKPALGRPPGSVAAVTLDASLPNVRCRSADLIDWQTRADHLELPFGEWVRQALNAYRPGSPRTRN